MAEKLFGFEPPVKKQKKYTLPNLGGKFGFSLFTGTKEFFIGISVGDVEIEQVVRRKLIKTQKGTVRVFQTD